MPAISAPEAELPRAIVESDIDAAAECIYTNNLLGGSYRGFGNPQISFARETLLDEIASRLGRDPLTAWQQSSGLEGGHQGAHADRLAHEEAARLRPNAPAADVAAGLNKGLEGELIRLVADLKGVSNKQVVADLAEVQAELAAAQGNRPDRVPERPPIRDPMLER